MLHKFYPDIQSVVSPTLCLLCWRWQKTIPGTKSPSTSTGHGPSDGVSPFGLGKLWRVCCVLNSCGTLSSSRRQVVRTQVFLGWPCFPRHISLGAVDYRTHSKSEYSSQRKPAFMLRGHRVSVALAMPRAGGARHSKSQ